jgi:nicotinate-nucleotide adenylyltransferase
LLPSLIPEAPHLSTGSVLLLGGTFDPVHCGHLLMLRAAMEYFGYDEGWLIPAARAPHKEVGPIVSDVARMAMLSAAIGRERGFRVWNGEVLRGGTSWTIDTIRELKHTYAGTRFGWLIGGDNLPGLHRWKEASSLIEACAIHVVRRPGDTPEAWTSKRLGLPAEWCTSLPERTFSAGQWDVSSTQVRRRLAEGRSIKWLVPDAVEEYIHRFSLYGPPEAPPTGDAS